MTLKVTKKIQDDIDKTKDEIHEVELRWVDGLITDDEKGIEIQSLLIALLTVNQQVE